MSATDILIAEYDSLVAQELASHLEGFGYTVIGIAISGEDALAKIEQLNPDLVVMNIRLKGAIDGIQTGSLIRSYRNIPIVYVVDTGGPATIRRAGATEPFGYIFKPFDERRIFATVETALLRHDLESKLHQSRQWLNTTLTSIGDGVIATDEQGRVRFINPSAMEQTGWPQTDAIGKFLHEIFTLVDETTLQPIELLDSQARPAPAALQKRYAGLLVAKNQKTVCVEGNMTSIQDAKAEVYGNVLVFRDVTRQKESLQEIQRQADRAEALVEVASR
jgi:PAS domain S-box-containing protein